MTTLEKFIELLNVSNNQTLKAEDITLSVPQPWSAEGDHRNTEIVATGVLSNGYSGSQPLYYHRVDLSLLFSGVHIVVEVPHSAASTVHVVNSLNAQFSGLNLDIDDVNIHSIADGAETYTLTSLDRGLYLTGEVTVGVAREMIDVLTEITETELDGFAYAQSV